MTRAVSSVRAMRLFDGIAERNALAVAQLQSSLGNVIAKGESEMLKQTMNRREAMRQGGFGVGSLALTGAMGGVITESVLPAPACLPTKKVSGTVKILTGAVGELVIIFPSNSLLPKIIKLATDFDADWIAGKFADAKTLFENLTSVVDRVISDLAISASTRVKLLLATLGIAARTIAALIDEQIQTLPAVADAAARMAPETIAKVKRMADPNTAAKILAAVK